MTNSRRDARICLAITVFFAATGVYFALKPSWWCAPAFYIALLLGWCERRLTADHRRQLRTHDRGARRTALIDGLAGQPAAPCCSFWVHSDGEIHAPGCTSTTRSGAA